jgi:hypothetical protein
MAGIGFHSVLANRSQMCTADLWHAAVLGMPRSLACRGPWHAAVFRPRIATQKKLVPWIATKKIIVLRIAIVKSLNLRADCQRVISVVANRGIGARFATTDGNPVIAVLHPQSPCLMHYRYLFSTRYLTCTRYAADCLGLNYTGTGTSMVSVCHLPVSRDTLPVPFKKIKFVRRKAMFRLPAIRLETLGERLQLLVSPHLADTAPPGVVHCLPPEVRDVTATENLMC